MHPMRENYKNSKIEPILNELAVFYNFVLYFYNAGPVNAWLGKRKTILIDQRLKNRPRSTKIAGQDRKHRPKPKSQSEWPKLFFLEERLKKFMVAQNFWTIKNGFGRSWIELVTISLKSKIYLGLS